MKTIIFIFCTLFLTTSVWAQHEFSFGGGFGSTNLNFDVPSSRGKKKGQGGNFGLGYTYNLNEKWGVRTGLTLAFYNAKYEGNGHGWGVLDPDLFPNITIQQDHYFFYETSSKGNRENVSATYLQVPIMAQFSGARQHTWYFAAGVKLLVPVSGKWSNTVEEITARGYISHTQEMFENMPELGFTTFYNLSGNGNFDFKFRTSFAMETGMRWTLSNNLKFYTGFFVDHVFIGIQTLDLRLGPLALYNGENPPIIRNNVYLGGSRNLGGTAIGATMRLSLSR